MVAIEAVTTTGDTAALCHSVGLARATLYRRRRPAPPSTPPVRAASARALGLAERQVVLDVLHSERFLDSSYFARRLLSDVPPTRRNPAASLEAMERRACWTWRQIDVPLVESAG